MPFRHALSLLCYEQHGMSRVGRNCMKDYEEELKDTKDVSDENEHKDDYEDV